MLFYDFKYLPNNVFNYLIYEYLTQEYFSDKAYIMRMYFELTYILSRDTRL